MCFGKSTLNFVWGGGGGDCGRIAFLPDFFPGRNKFYDPMRHSGQSCLTEVE